VHVTGNQLKSARALRDETLEGVSARCGLSLATVWKFESAGDEVPSAMTRTMDKLLGYFESGGIRFVNTPGNLGVLLQRERQEAP
jgi:transcriptional regulator with XRE-family HTH domain